MDKSDKILVTGASGLVGSALRRALEQRNLTYLAPTKSECDFTDRDKTFKYFERNNPTLVFHLAAKVGGIAANMADPVGFLYQNNLISGHVLEACHKFSIKKTVQLGSSCIYPRACPQPMREDHILTGPLEPTNEGYALAKISAMKLGQYYHNQFKMKVVCPIASNIYGPGDHFDLERSHVLSALVLRFSQAKQEGKPSVTLWGTGSARRQFIHVDDVAQGLIFFMDNVDDPSPVNLAPEGDVSIKELAEMVAKLVGYSGRIEWDHSKPDGMPRKSLDISKLKQLKFTAKISLQDGINDVIKDYNQRRS